MSIYSSNIEKLRAIHESSFGVDMTGLLPGSWFTIPFREGTLKITPGNQLESPMHAQQMVDGHPEEVDIPTTVVVEFESNIETFTTKAESGISATQSWFGKLLETWMGKVHLMAGTTVNDVASNGNSFTVTTATTLRPGAALAIANANGLLECREIKSKTGSNIVLKHFLSQPPANAAPVLGSATYYCNPYTTGDEFKSLQFLLEGYTPDDKWVTKGGGITQVEITVENGQITKMKWTVTFAIHHIADGVDVAANLVGTVLTPATYLDTVTLVQSGSEFCTADPGQPDSVVTEHPSAMSFEPGIVHAMPRTPGGCNTVLGFVRTHGPGPVLVIKFTEPYEDRRWFDLLKGHDPVAQWHQLGSIPSEGAVVFSAPHCQVKDVQRVNADGIQAQEITLIASHDTDTTAETGYEGLAHSAFRIHMF